jgi:hypothetical protein
LTAQTPVHGTRAWVPHLKKQIKPDRQRSPCSQSGVSIDTMVRQMDRRGRLTVLYYARPLFPSPCRLVAFEKVFARNLGATGLKKTLSGFPPLLKRYGAHGRPAFLVVKVLCQFDCLFRDPLLFQNNLMLRRSHPIGLHLPFSTDSTFIQANVRH